MKGFICCWSSFCKSFAIPYTKWLKTLDYAISHDRHQEDCGTPKFKWNKPQGTKYWTKLWEGPFPFLSSSWWTWSAFLASVLLYHNMQDSQNICGSLSKSTCYFSSLNKVKVFSSVDFSQESNKGMLFITFFPKICVTSGNKYVHLSQLCSFL